MNAKEALRRLSGANALSPADEPRPSKEEE